MKLEQILTLIKQVRRNGSSWMGLCLRGQDCQSRPRNTPPPLIGLSNVGVPSGKFVLFFLKHLNVRIGTMSRRKRARCVRLAG